MIALNKKAEMKFKDQADILVKEDKVIVVGENRAGESKRTIGVFNILTTKENSLANQLKYFKWKTLTIFCPDIFQAKSNSNESKRVDFYTTSSLSS